MYTVSCQDSCLGNLHFICQLDNVGINQVATNTADHILHVMYSRHACNSRLETQTMLQLLHTLLAKVSLKAMCIHNLHAKSCRPWPIHMPVMRQHLRWQHSRVNGCWDDFRTSIIAQHNDSRQAFTRILARACRMSTMCVSSMSHVYYLCIKHRTSHMCMASDVHGQVCMCNP